MAPVGHGAKKYEFGWSCQPKCSCLASLGACSRNGYAEKMLLALSLTLMSAQAEPPAGRNPAWSSEAALVIERAACDLLIAQISEAEAAQADADTRAEKASALMDQAQAEAVSSDEAHDWREMLVMTLFSQMASAQRERIRAQMAETQLRSVYRAFCPIRP